MAFLNRGTSNPQLTGTNAEGAALGSKSHKRYLQELQSEVTKSRMAIVPCAPPRKTSPSAKPWTKASTRS